MRSRPAPLPERLDAAPRAAARRAARRAATVGLLTLGLVLGLRSPAARADEELVEDLSGARHFAPMWPGGTFELGEDSGFHWARIVTDGEAGSTFVANVRPYKPLIDASGKFVKVRIKVDDVSKLSGMEFRLSSDRFASSYYAFSFPLYDDSDFNIVRDGVWTTLTFPFGSGRVEGEPDRSHIDSLGWYVSDKGNGAPLTAWWGGISLVDEPTEGVVTITFDDGYDENLVAAEIMARHGMKGTAYIIPESIGQNGYLNHHQLVDMQLRYGWDIAAHHQTPFTELRPDELENVILGVKQFLAENDFGAGAVHLAYPLGRQNTALVRPLVRKHFATARVAAMGPETLPPADPHLLRVLNVTNETRPEDVVAAAQRAKDDKEWLILMLHYLVEKPENSLQYPVADFEKMIAGIAKTQVRVLPMTQVWAACGRDFTDPSADGGCRFDAANVAAPKP
jgi:peptidoglycan/xylan/chitin deacetylase (PgdA/CDA1 family)